MTGVALEDTRARLVALIEEVLDFAQQGYPSRRYMRGAAAQHHFGLGVFRHAEPLGQFNEVLAQMRVADLDEQDPARLVPSIDVVTLIPGDDDLGPPPARFVLSRVRTLSAAEKRGRVHPWTPYAVSYQSAVAFADGTYQSFVFYWGFYGGIWRPCGTERERTPEEEAWKIGVYHQLAFYRPMMWHVDIGYGSGGPSVLLPCDATAILHLFRYRELPPGKTRRDALLHWVTAHWRRTPTRRDDVVRVAAHLRGVTRFAWQDGLAVQILPAEEDKKLVKDWHKHAADPVAPR